MIIVSSCSPLGIPYFFIPFPLCLFFASSYPYSVLCDQSVLFQVAVVPRLARRPRISNSSSRSLCPWRYQLLPLWLLLTATIRRRRTSPSPASDTGYSSPSFSSCRSPSIPAGWLPTLLMAGRNVISYQL